MKLTKFRIQNFKSIIDSGYCTFASDLTILVGKNESGKTATLEALKYFSKDAVRIPEDVFPIDGNNKEPLVEICFSLERGEIEQIQESSGIKLADEAIGYVMKQGLTVIKDSRGRYRLSEDCIQELFSDHDHGNDLPIKHIKSAKEKLHELLGTPHFPTIDYESSNEAIQKQSKDFIKFVKSRLPAIKDEKTQTEIVQAIRVIVKESVRLTEAQQPKEKKGEEVSSEQKMNSAAFFTEQFVERLPTFIFFSEFSDILPFEVPISELKNNQAVLDFAKISGLDLDYFIETQDVQRRINFLNRHSTQISGNFLQYWNQNKIELIVKSEGESLLFGVKEQGKTDFFKVEQRSKGFQWFLSFYLRINAQKSDNNFLIIDEPGTHLHANAQKEILKILEKEIVQDMQIIFSTHCPYLIDPQKLDRIRLVLKDQQAGTVISDDIHSHTGEECMAPVMTAMGGEQANIAPLSGKQNVIVGTVHDFYFWKAMRGYVNDLDYLKDINLLPATNLDHAQQLVAMMISYDLDFQLLLNHNNDGWKVGQQLKEKFGFGDEKITFVSEKLGFYTEDLFAFEDFNTHVINGEGNEEQAMLNSTYLKDNEMNKVLLARSFYEKTQRQKDNIKLSDETIAAFRNTFERILERFHALVDVPVEEKGTESQITKQQELPKGGVKRRSLFAFLRKK